MPARTIDFARGLERFGDRAAVRSGGATVTYADLAARADEVARRIGGERRLVLLRAKNDVASLVAHLGALRGGHAVVVAADDDAVAGPIARVYGPSVVLRSDDGHVEVRADAPAAPGDLHPELALLLSTSGSTGSPKLVRLSAGAVQANADAIAAFLGLGAGDAAITTLPMHYCFGLSVLHSHLAAGATVVVTDRSVLDPAFWDEFRSSGATSFAGVPYTFDLLDRVGFRDMPLPGLRQVQQAGGRLAPRRVRDLAAHGRRAGWDLFVMYGQTEATARMAYLPPASAESHPEAVGVPVPGGSFEIVPVDGLEGAGTGELVYRGPNVMMGYAESPRDLELGHTVDALATGDLARRNDAGLYEIVGRRSRFVKLFGLRLDLDRVESALAEAGVAATCAGDDDGLAVAAAPDDAPLVAGELRRRFGIPADRVAVLAVEEIPRLPNGKPDHAAIVAGARSLPLATRATAPAARPDADGEAVRRLFAEVFPGTRVDDDSTFASLGGDSLSYVEMSVRLAEALGQLPDEWPSLSVAELTARSEPAMAAPAPGWRAVETGVFVRALAVVAVVGTHAGLFRLRGGAHLLLALAGYNFARFTLGGGEGAVTARVTRSAARVAVPAVAWMALLLLTTDDYDLPNLLLLNGRLGDVYWDQRWRYWYVEALVQILLVAGALLAVPALRRLERRRPFPFAVALVGATLALRLQLDDLGGITRPLHRPETVAWIFAIGWLGAAASTARQRLVAAAIALAATPSFFSDDVRAAVVVGGFALILARPTVRIPASLVRVAAAVASASLHIYLTHWQVYPVLLATAPPAVAVAACLVVGIAARRASEWLSGRARAARSRSASSAAAGATAPALAG